MRRAVTLVFVLSYLLAACAGEDALSDPVPGQGDASDPTVPSPAGENSAAALRLARAPAATAAARTAHTTFVMTVAGMAGRPESFTFLGEGVIDFAAGMSRSLLDLSDALGTTRTTDTELETITAGGQLFVRAPVLTFLSSDSEPWVRIDPMASGQDDPGKGGLGLAPLAGLAGSDAGAPIALLAGIDASSVREIGDVPGGDNTITTLRAAVDPLAASRQDTTPEELAALEAFLDRLGARQLQVDVELDENDRLRSLVYEHAVPSPTGAVHQRFEVRYHDFGTAVEIDVPVDTQVRDLLDKGLQGPR